MFSVLLKINDFIFKRTSTTQKHLKTGTGKVDFLERLMALSSQIKNKTIPHKSIMEIK